jgi:hypothetical protein
MLVASQRILIDQPVVSSFTFFFAITQRNIRVESAFIIGAWGVDETVKNWN